MKIFYLLILCLRGQSLRSCISCTEEHVINRNRAIGLVALQTLVHGLDTDKCLDGHWDSGRFEPVIFGDKNRGFLESPTNPIEDDLRYHK